MINLNSKLFENSNSREAFKEILETLDHINPVFVDRKEFDSMKWRFLLENWEDKFWKFYDLYLPVDLNNKDLFQVVFLLNEKFSLWLDIKKFIWYVRLWTKGISNEEILNLKKENEEKIEMIILENSLPVDSFSKYQQEIDSSIFSLRKSIREIKGYKNQKNEVDKKENTKRLKDIDDLDDLIESLYTTEFDLSFFRKSMDMLRYGLMTLTRKEFEEIKSRPRKEGEKIITSKILPEFLDIEEQKLREKIWIDDFKKKLEEARKANDKELIVKLEKKATNQMIWILHTKYPYQLTSDDYWYQPNKILRYKELYCVWFSLVGHCFLSELWIKHNWLAIPEHSALEIFIWDDGYYFDPTSCVEIYKLKWWRNVEFDGKKWIYKNFGISINEKSNYFMNYKIALSWDPEKILLSQILNNKWCDLSSKWDFDWAIKICNSAIQFNPNYEMIYNNKWNTLLKKWDFDWAIKMFNRAIEINPKFEHAYCSNWNTLLKKWDFDKAIEMYNLATQINFKFTDAYFKKWNALFEKWDFNWAIKMYNRVIQLDPNYEEAYYNKWSALSSKWDFDWAIKMYDIVIQLDPNYEEAYYNKWSALSSKWDFDWAIKMYDIAIQLNPSYEEAYNNKWNALFKKWDFDQAIKILDKALEINPNYGRSYLNKWLIFEEMINPKLHNINMFIYNLLKYWKDWTFDFDLIYRKEKKEIRRLFEMEDFEWIRLYMLSIEKS